MDKRVDFGDIFTLQKLSKFQLKVSKVLGEGWEIKKRLPEVQLIGLTDGERERVYLEESIIITLPLKVSLEEFQHDS